MTFTPDNPFRRKCGCLHRGVGYEWEYCPTHTLRREIEAKLEQIFGRPECPECLSDARREKCLWEASYCPRHPVLRRWEELNDAAFRYVQYVQDGENVKEPAD